MCPAAAGFEKPSAIQSKGIVPFTKGYDVIQQAQSGTGKTATFCAGILNNIDYSSNECQALVLAPTRELAQQIEKVMRALGDFLQVRQAVPWTMGRNSTEHALPGPYKAHGLRGCVAARRSSATPAWAARPCARTPASWALASRWAPRHTTHHVPEREQCWADRHCHGRERQPLRAELAPELTVDSATGFAASRNGGCGYG